jgi:hypothetical protein
MILTPFRRYNDLCLNHKQTHRHTVFTDQCLYFFKINIMVGSLPVVSGSRSSVLEIDFYTFAHKILIYLLTGAFLYLVGNLLT